MLSRTLIRPRLLNPLQNDLRPRVARVNFTRSLQQRKRFLNFAHLSKQVCERNVRLDEIRTAPDRIAEGGHRRCPLSSPGTSETKVKMSLREIRLESHHAFEHRN